MATKEDKQRLADLYVKALDGFGLSGKPDEDSDGDVNVVFKHPDMGTFVIFLDADRDPEFMRMVFPNFADQRIVGGDSDKLLAVVNDVNRKSKAAKLYVTHSDGEANVSVAIECFVAGPDEFPTQTHLNAIMKRCVSAVRSAVGNLLKQAKSAADDAA